METLSADGRTGNDNPTPLDVSEIHRRNGYPAVYQRLLLKSSKLYVTSSNVVVTDIIEDTMENTEYFVQQLTENQNRLFGYVYSLLGDHSRTSDVVQETNLVLWRKLDEFQTDKPFLPWALAVARFQVMAHLRDKKRDRLLLDAELAATLSAEAEQQAETLDSVREALRPCMQLLTVNNRELIEQRYFREMSVNDVASSVNRTAGSIKVALLRIRRKLADCIEQRLMTET